MSRRTLRDDLDEQIFVRMLDPETNATQVAKDLGIHRNTVRRRIEGPNYLDNTKHVRELAQEAIGDKFDTIEDGGVYGVFATLLHGLANANRADKEDWAARRAAADTIRAVYGLDAPKEQKLTHGLDAMSSEELMNAVMEAIDDEDQGQTDLEDGGHHKDETALPLSPGNPEIHQGTSEQSGVGQETQEFDQEYD